MPHEPQPSVRFDPEPMRARESFQKQNHTENARILGGPLGLQLGESRRNDKLEYRYRCRGQVRGRCRVPPARVVAREKAEPGSVSGTSASPGTPLDLSAPPLSYLPNGRTEQYIGVL